MRLRPLPSVRPLILVPLVVALLGAVVGAVVLLTGSSAPMAVTPVGISPEPLVDLDEAFPLVDLPAAPAPEGPRGTGHPAVQAAGRTDGAPTGRFRLERHASPDGVGPPILVLDGRWDVPRDRVAVRLDTSGADQRVTGVTGPGPIEMRRIGAEVAVRDPRSGAWSAVGADASLGADGGPRDVLALVAGVESWDDPVAASPDEVGSTGAGSAAVARWSGGVRGPAVAELVVPSVGLDRRSAERIEGRVTVWVDAEGWARRTDVVLDPVTLVDPDATLDELAAAAAADLRVSVWWSELGQPQRIDRPPLGAPPAG